MKKIFIPVIICLLGLGLTSESHAQCDPLPSLLISKTKGQEILEEFSKDRFFNKSKLTRLNDISTINPPNTSFIYRWEAFEALIKKVRGYDQMRIHFAIYQECNLPNFPKLSEPTLILLFSPEIKNANPQNFFFLNENDKTVYEVPYPCAKSWIANFERHVQPQLRKTIDPNDPENSDKTVPDKFSDTKSILYTKDKFENAFITEQTYQTAHHTAITAIKVNFSAYTKKGRDVKPNDPDQNHYKKRLLIQFNYMTRNAITGIEEVFDLEDQADFECRLNSTLKREYPQFANIEHLSLRIKIRKRSIDNGLLCPTNCP